MEIEGCVLISLCLPLKQLEAICVQVQPGQMKETERPVPSLAPIQSKTVMLSQSVGRNSSMPGLGIINPQIIKIQPVTGPEQQQQLFLHSSSESPVQLLMQKPLPSHGSVPVNKIPTSKVLNGQKTARATVSPARSSNIAASSTNTLMPCLEKKQKDDKLKKSLKVKTRSGRISRPPKYKAKDYKFIKMEDLADSHQSDSDDYSELIIEDDEEGKVKGKDALFNSSNYNLKPKMFKCQTCEKSYIGKGGLARHYKLNPGHGQLESVPQKTPLNKPNGSISMDNLCGIGEEIMSPVHLNSIAVTLNNENALPTNLEETAGSQVEQTCKSAESRKLLAEQQNESSSGQRGPITAKGPGRPRRPKRRGRPRMGGRSRCSGRLSRPGQSPSKPLSSVSTERNVFRRRARLKELIQQCDNEDLMELVLPRLTELVTVYEFLLMKVEKGCPAKAYFPDVYREFEELHNMVKKMAYDYLSNSDFLSCQQPIEIKDAKVAESLGITEITSGEQKMQGVDSCSQCIIKMVSEQVPVETLGQKRLAEISLCHEVDVFISALKLLMPVLAMASVTSPVLFKEFCPLYYLLNAIPTKIQKGFRSIVVYLTALDTNGDYIAVGSSIGMLYLYCRHLNQMKKYNFEGKCESITFVKLLSCFDDLVAVGTASGRVAVFQLVSSLPGRNKQLRRFDVAGIHKSSITALAWSPNGMKLFSGDDRGKIVYSALDLDHGVCNSSLVLEEPSSIVQLDYNQKVLLVSTLQRTILFYTEERSVKQVGTQPRKK
uniref:Zinc finger protein 839 n=1 Tax=Meleagris gallopavo TaxID=9103 RepID=G1NKX5_MELGA